MNRRIIAFLTEQSLVDIGGTFSQVAVFWTALSLTGSAISVGSLGGVWTFSMAVIMGITSFLGGVLQPLSLSLAMVFVDRAGLGTVLVAVGALNLAMVFLTAWLLPLREKEWTLSTPKARWLAGRIGLWKHTKLLWLFVISSR